MCRQFLCSRSLHVTWLAYASIVAPHLKSWQPLDCFWSAAHLRILQQQASMLGHGTPVPFVLAHGSAEYLNNLMTPRMPAY